MVMLQVNTLSLSHNNNKQLLIMFLINNNIDIAILSKIWVRHSTDCSIPRYKFYGRPRD